MKWLVALLGLLMVASGGYWGFTGSLIVQVERGWSAVIGGAVVFSSGMLMLALASVMSALDRLSKATLASAEAKPRPAPAMPASAGVSQAQAPVAIVPVAAPAPEPEDKSQLKFELAPPAKPEKLVPNTTSVGAPAVAPAGETVVVKAGAAETARRVDGFDVPEPKPARETPAAPPAANPPEPAAIDLPGPSNSLDASQQPEFPQPPRRPAPNPPIRPILPRPAAPPAASHARVRGAPPPPPPPGRVQPIRPGLATPPPPPSIEPSPGADAPPPVRASSPDPQSIGWLERALRGGAQAPGEPPKPLPSSAKADNQKKAEATTAEAAKEPAKEAASVAPPRASARDMPPEAKAFDEKEPAEAKPAAPVADVVEKKPGPGALPPAPQPVRASTIDPDDDEEPLDTFIPEPRALADKPVEKFTPDAPEQVAPEQVLEKPVAQKQVAEDQGAEKQGPDKQEIDKLAVDEPISERPATEKPVIEKPVAQRTVADLPRVVRRYESQGVRYTLYDNGSIDADSPTGRYRFASLDELKEFLEKKA